MSKKTWKKGDACHVGKQRWDGVVLEDATAKDGKVKVVYEVEALDWGNKMITKKVTQRVPVKLLDSRVVIA